MENLRSVDHIAKLFLCAKHPRMFQQDNNNKSIRKPSIYIDDIRNLPNLYPMLSEKIRSFDLLV